MMKNLVRKNRSYRRFYQNFPVKRKTLMELVDLARFSSSAANLQPLKYILSFNARKNALIFLCLKWAGYLNHWSGPEEGEKPAAYIIILGDTRITKTFGCDCGIAAEAILLGATEKGLGGCMLGAIDRKRIKKALKIPGFYEVLLVLAVGKPKEKITLKKITPRGSIKYWRDKNQKHYVPKRRLKDIIIK